MTTRTKRDLAGQSFGYLALFSGRIGTLLPPRSRDGLPDLLPVGDIPVKFLVQSGLLVPAYYLNPIVLLQAVTAERLKGRETIPVAVATLACPGDCQTVNGDFVVSHGYSFSIPLSPSHYS